MMDHTRGASHRNRCRQTAKPFEVGDAFVPVHTLGSFHSMDFPGVRVRDTRARLIDGRYDDPSLRHDYTTKPDAPADAADNLSPKSPVGCSPIWAQRTSSLTSGTPPGL